MSVAACLFAKQAKRYVYIDHQSYLYLHDEALDGLLTPGIEMSGPALRANLSMQHAWHRTQYGDWLGAHWLGAHWLGAHWLGTALAFTRAFPTDTFFVRNDQHCPEFYGYTAGCDQHCWHEAMGIAPEDLHAYTPWKAIDWQEC